MHVFCSWYICLCECVGIVELFSFLFQKCWNFLLLFDWNSRKLNKKFDKYFLYANCEESFQIQKWAILSQFITKHASCRWYSDGTNSPNSACLNVELCHFSCSLFYKTIEKSQTLRNIWNPNIFFKLFHQKRSGIEVMRKQSNLYKEI